MVNIEEIAIKCAEEFTSMAHTSPLIFKCHFGEFAKSIIKAVDKARGEETKDFYKHMWEDFVSLQKGDAKLLCKAAERYEFIRSNPEFDIRILNIGKCSGERLDQAIDFLHKENK